MQAVQNGKSLDITDSSSNLLNIELKVTPYRWLVLFFYVLGASLGAAVSITLTPVAILIAAAYEVTLLDVNLCTLCFGITSVPMFFLSMKMFTVMSTASTLRLGAFFLCIGCWIR
jgi:hypothetical protein